jgi:hypothetical protein
VGGICSGACALVRGRGVCVWGGGGGVMCLQRKYNPVALVGFIGFAAGCVNTNPHTPRPQSHESTEKKHRGRRFPCFRSL